MIAGSWIASRRTFSHSRGDSQATWFEGNYQAYAEWRREQLGDKAGPHRVRYRSFEGLGGPVLLLVAAGTRAR